MALEKQQLEKLIDLLFLRLLTRAPTREERMACISILEPGYETRIVANPPAAVRAGPHVRPKYVSWSNHLTSEANVTRVEQAAATRRGDPPTARLNADWRERFEDVLWGLLNAPEWSHVL